MGVALAAVALALVAVHVPYVLLPFWWPGFEAEAEGWRATALTSVVLSPTLSLSLLFTVWAGTRSEMTGWSGYLAVFVALLVGGLNLWIGVVDESPLGLLGVAWIVVALGLGFAVFRRIRRAPVGGHRG